MHLNLCIKSIQQKFYKYFNFILIIRYHQSLGKLYIWKIKIFLIGIFQIMNNQLKINNKIYHQIKTYISVISVINKIVNF